jgi:hypothetical protein
MRTSFVARPAEQQAEPPEQRAAPRSARLIRLWNGMLIAALIVLAVASLLAFRLQRAPDLFADEGLYASVSANLAAGRGLVENSGRPFIWHPPLFMIAGGGLLWASGAADAGPIGQILALRQLSVLAAAVTVGALFALGWRIGGRACAVAAALLFALDPYIQRINRRAMLEPLAGALGVVALWLALDALGRPRWLPRALAAGFVFGLAALTKEIMLLGPAAVVLYAALFRRERLGRAGVVAGAAAAVYGVYPLGIAAAGLWPAYADMKTRQLFRLVSKLAGAPAPPPTGTVVTGARVSVWENLLMTAPPYFWSYVLIAVGGLLIARIAYGVLPWARWRPGPALLLTAIYAALNYLVVGASFVFGNGSDQFFYYVIVPATLLVGWGLVALWRWAGASAGPRLRRALAAGCGLLLAAALIWNVGVYVRVFAAARDDSYVRLVAYLHEHVPPGATIVVGNDLANYILPDYTVRFDRQPEDIERRKIRYVVLSSKERWGGYNNVSREFYDWVAAHGEPRLVLEGPTFWTLTLFEMHTAEQPVEQYTEGRPAPDDRP